MKCFQGLGLYSLITQTQALIMLYGGNSVVSCWAIAHSKTKTRAHTHTILSTATSAQTQHSYAISPFTHFLGVLVSKLPSLKVLMQSYVSFFLWLQCGFAHQLIPLRDHYSYTITAKTTSTIVHQSLKERFYFHLNLSE